MILQGNPKHEHVFAHISDDGLMRIGMSDTPDPIGRGVGSEITLTPIAEERLWRLLNERRQLWLEGQYANS